jgi:hypothetical protein
MAETELTTVDLYQQALEAAAKLPGDTADFSPAARPRAGFWERAASRLSLLLGSALAVVVSLMALGYFNAAKDSVSARAKKSNNAIDWLLWFGGAKQDQTFERYLRDTTEKSREEWEEQYRKSPISQFSREGIDWSKARSDFKLAPAFSSQPPHKN